MDNCLDQIYLLESDFNMEAASVLRKTMLPVLETRYKQAGTGIYSMYI
jgi:hypothetical protein